MSAAERLAAAARDALTSTFEALAPGISEVPPPELVTGGADALAGTEAPAVLAHAVPTEGVTGPVTVVLTAAGARRLAAVLGAIDEEEAEFGGGDLGDRLADGIGDARDHSGTSTDPRTWTARRLPLRPGRARWTGTSSA